jgi:hypothetical protein
VADFSCAALEGRNATLAVFLLHLQLLPYHWKPERAILSIKKNKEYAKQVLIGLRAGEDIK